MAKYCIGIDLGGTFIKTALMEINGSARRFFGIGQTPTPLGGGEIVEAMVNAANRLMTAEGIDRDDVIGVGIGSPGPLDTKAGVIVGAMNLPGLKGVPLRDEVSKGLCLPAVLENDANAAALGEYLFGAGRDADTLAMLTLGTGVGGGIIVHGMIHHGAHDFGAECGHIIVQPGGRQCTCGQRGCLEQYSSASFLARRAAEAVEAGRPSSLTDVLASKGSLDAADVNAARHAGDELAAEIWDDAARYLAQACVTLMRVLDTDQIVLAGGLTKAGDDLLTPVRRHVAEMDWKMTDLMCRIEIAQLGNDAGVVGAAGVAWQAFGRQD